MTSYVPRRLDPKDLDAWLQKESGKPILVDVREDYELAIASFPAPVIHLPLSESSRWIEILPEKMLNSQPVVVICHSGIRSWNFANWLIEEGWAHEVWNLEGGIDAWSKEVDNSVPRY